MQGIGIVNSSKSWSLFEDALQYFPSHCFPLGIAYFSCGLYSQCVFIVPLNLACESAKQMLLVSPIIAIHIIIDLNHHGAWLLKDTTLEGILI